MPSKGKCKRNIILNNADGSQVKSKDVPLYINVNRHLHGIQFSNELGVKKKKFFLSFFSLSSSSNFSSRSDMLFAKIRVDKIDSRYLCDFAIQSFDLCC